MDQPVIWLQGLCTLLDMLDIWMMLCLLDLFPEFQFFSGHDATAKIDMENSEIFIIWKIYNFIAV